MMDVDDDLVDAKGTKARESDFEECATIDFDEGFGTCVGNRAQACAEACSEDHGLHWGTLDAAEYLTSVGRPFRPANPFGTQRTRKSERGRKNRPAPFGMTVNGRRIKRSDSLPRPALAPPT